MSHLSDLRKFRIIAEKALAQFPLSQPKLTHVSFTENVVYKITAKEGLFLLRIHATSFRTAPAIQQELDFLSQLYTEAGINVQMPLAAKNGQNLAHVENHIISILTWQTAQKKRKSIADKHFKILGTYLAKLHNFTHQNKHHIPISHRLYWTPENLLGEQPILGRFKGLEAIKGFVREIFEACRTQTYEKIKHHADQNPNLFSVIHADLHFSNILWRGDELLAIDFDDCGHGCHLHDLSIPIMNMNSAQPEHHRDLILDSYNQTRSINSADIAVIDDYILCRHIVMQGWLLARSSHPKIKQYQAMGMPKAMNALKSALR